MMSGIKLKSLPAAKHPQRNEQTSFHSRVKRKIASLWHPLGVSLQVRAVIIPGTISTIGAVIIALGTPISSVLATVMVAAMWKFPIPYGYVIMLNLYVLFFVMYMFLVIGPRVLASSPMLREQIKSELFIMANQSGVAVSYPIFSAVFNHLSGVQLTLFIFVMPLIKFITKQNTANSATSFYEYVGPILVFSVDLFNVYYVAICMQASKSMSTTLILMGIDSIHISVIEHYLRDLPTVVRKVFESPTHSHDRRIRLFAPFPLPLLAESKSFINELARTGVLPTMLNDHSSWASQSIRCQITHDIRSSKATPSSPCELICKDPTQMLRPTSPATTDAAISDDSIQDALQSLFHSEYVLLAEYVECMVPILYALYLAVLFHLDVAAYYPHTATMTTNKLKETVTNILIYAALEVILFGALLVFLKRKFGFSPLFQLAFVLETQAPAIQGHFFLWTISILHITLVHYGTWYRIARFLIYISTLN
ncbi:hypothetical protein GQ600_12984 [Phytophthora cactorum]|nr:hypothetical protein GQ600_12984 [Phytophthora cactorum]